VKAAAAILAAVLAGCATTTHAPDVRMVTYGVTVALTGAVSAAPTAVGTVPVPEGSFEFPAIAVAVATPVAQKALEGHACTFGGPPVGARQNGVVTVALTGTCTIDKTPATETITVVFTPAKAG
jgi:hypothetical protein